MADLAFYSEVKTQSLNGYRAEKQEFIRVIFHPAQRYDQKKHRKIKNVGDDKHLQVRGESLYTPLQPAEEHPIQSPPKEKQEKGTAVEQEEKQ